MGLLRLGASLAALAGFWWWSLRVLHGPCDQWAERDLQWMSPDWCVRHLPGMRRRG